MLAVDPVTPTTIYAGTLYGLFKSTNSGDVWSATGLTTGVSAFAIDPATPRTLYAGSGRLLKSIDGGDTWRVADTDPAFADGVSALAIDPSVTSTIYAGLVGCGFFDCGGVVFKSTDGGSTWNRTGLSHTADALAIDPQVPGTIYAGATDCSFGRGGGCSGGVFKSTDGGVSWDSTGLDVLHAQTLAIDPVEPRHIYVGTALDGAFRSEDGGVTWTPLNTGLTNPNVLALVIDPIPAGAGLGTRGGAGATRLYAGTAGSGVFVIELTSTCAGDCGRDGSVSVDDLIALVNIALGSTSIVQCGSGDANGDGAITIDEIIAAVNRALQGCG
jgi:photosystem II stability/assembly factor-like uncharacterized protein